MNSCCSKQIFIDSMKIKILFFLSIFIFLSSFSSIASEVPVYQVFELDFSASQNYENPYLKMPGDSSSPGFVVGIFSGPQGEELTVDGFWDGGNSWKVRMVPVSVGKWTYRTLSADPGMNNREGTFTALPSSGRGFIRVNPRHPHHFQWDNGEPFYWTGTAMQISHFDSRGAQGGRRRIDDESFVEFLKSRQLQGFTTAFWGFYGFNKKQFNLQSQRNEGGPPFTEFNPDRLNPHYYQYGDLRIKALIERDIIPMFTLGWPDQGLAQLGHERLKRYWRYIIARYSAYNVIWNLFGEADEFPDWQSVVNDYGQLTRTFDPYDHLISTHLTKGPNMHLATQPWYDFVILQASAAETSNYLALKKPIINAEYGGYEGFNADAGTLMKLMWEIRMRGGYFVYEGWLDDIDSQGARYAGLCNHFFQTRTRYWALEFHPEIFKRNPGLADPGREYVTYLSGAQPAGVDLPNGQGEFAVEFFNPMTAELVQGKAVRGGSKISFTSPDERDWILHIYKHES